MRTEARPRPFRPRLYATLALVALCSCGLPAHQALPEMDQRAWLAGDHHSHSRYSVDWNRNVDPPEAIIGGDALYPIPFNALVARYFGLDWMVVTDHGGVNHSKINLDLAWPELQRSRRMVPEVLQFYGVELNSPGADHSSVIMPHRHDEAQQLYEIESRFDGRDEFSSDSQRNREPLMLAALKFMRDMEAPPVVIANHPSRSAIGMGLYGKTTPAELRNWNNTAPEVAVGMAGAPGRQANALARDGTATRGWARGRYVGYPTLGGFDQMTARLGGFWDSMLGEGRRWWITANSDSHIHYTEGGSDFWPGEFSKTYVFARRAHDDILDGLRHGRVFVTTGDLVSELDLQVSAGDARAGIGGELSIAKGATVEVTIRFVDPASLNHRGENPVVRRLDLIQGEVTGPLTDRETDTHAGTRVLARFDADDWRENGDARELRYRLGPVQQPLYLRLRGTNTDQLEPLPDLPSEDPWRDLWFYSNPVFIQPR